MHHQLLDEPDAESSSCRWRCQVKNEETPFQEIGEQLWEDGTSATIGHSFHTSSPRAQSERSSGSARGSVPPAGADGGQNVQPAGEGRSSRMLLRPDNVNGWVYN